MRSAEDYLSNTDGIEEQSRSVYFIGSNWKQRTKSVQEFGMGANLHTRNLKDKMGRTSKLMDKSLKVVGPIWI